MDSGGIWVKSGLARAAYRASEWVRAADLRTRRRNTQFRSSVETGGVPLPPERLVVRVAGSPDLNWFLAGGRLAADGIRQAVERHAPGFDSMTDVLDFGCGCGRVLRHVDVLPGQRHYGCDYNPELIDWCSTHLPRATFLVNRADPPLAWPADKFDLIWALSVFTHLTEARQQRWISELRRVLRPGGMLIASIQGRHYADQLSHPERQRFDRGELIVRFEGASGTNRCTAFHPERYLRERLTVGFEWLELKPAGATGNPHQDLLVLRKPNH